MAAQQDVEVTFERGMMLSSGDLENLPPGYGRYLSGWKPTQRGLFPRQPWLLPDVTGYTTPVWGRGFYAGFRNAGMRRPILVTWQAVARFDAGGQFRISEIPTTGGSDHAVDWNGALTTIETVAPTLADWAHYPVVFAAGMGFVLYSNPGFPSGRIHKWDGSAASAIVGDNLAGRALAYHQNRWFTGGSEVGVVSPAGTSSLIRFTEEEDPDDWNTTVNFIPVRSRDGDPVEAFCSWEGFLVVGKRDSMHFLYGSGPTSWGIREMTDQVGSASGQNAIVSTPKGLCFVGSDGYVYRWNGGGKPQRLTQHAIGVAKTYGYTVGSDYVVPTDPGSLAYIEPILYAWVPGTRGILAIDLDQGIEWYEEIASSRGRPHEVVSVDDYLVMTLRESLEPTDGDGPVWFRVPPYVTGEPNTTLTTTPKPDRWGSVFRWISGVITPAVLNGATQLKNIYIRYSQWHDGVDGNGVTVVVTNELGQTYTEVIGKNPGALDGRRWYWERLDAGLAGNAFTVEIYSDMADDTFTDTYSIERVVARFIGDVEPR